MTITPEEVAKLAAGATPGPWWTDGKYNGSEMGCSIIAARTDCGPLPGNPTRGMVAWASAILNTQARRCEANAAFIAAAHDMAALIAELEAKLAKAMAALVEVQEFVKDLEPYADQGHSLVPALQKACLTLAELTGEKK